MVNAAISPRLFLVCLIAFVALANISSAASCLNNATDIILSEQGTLIAAVMGLTIVVIACAYMIGHSLNKAEFTVFAKDEAYHLAISLVILFGFSGILVSTCTVMDSFFSNTMQNIGTNVCYAPGLSVNTVATCYLDLAKTDASGLSQRYIDNYINEMMDSTWSASIQIPLTNTYTATAGAYKRITSNQYNMIMNSFIFPALTSLSMQKLLLSFITENAIKWILPTAMFLRFFVLTRQMGNVLIALVLAIYIIIPFMYAFNGAMYTSVLDNCKDPAIAQATCDNIVDGGGCGSPKTTCTNPNSFWMVARLIPQAFFLPNLTIALVITFLSAANKALKVIG